MINLSLSGVYFLLFAKGFWSNKSSIPYWDEWDSRVNFWTNFNSSGASALFALHNEHRPVLTFVVFALDSWLFKGSGQFVYVINIVAIALIGYLFFLIFSNVLVMKNWSIRLAVALISTLPFFSLTGFENIYWVNQNSFFFSIIFSLLPFVYLLKIPRNSLSLRTASVATVLGLLATLCMASGLLIPFFLGIVFLFAYRQWLYFLCNFSLGTIAYLLYSNGITKNTGSDPVNALINQPILVAEYAFKFLTSPFSSGTAYSRLLGAVIGFASLAILLKNTVLVIRKPNTHSVIFLVLAYYFVSVAVLIGAGRIQFGVNQSLSSRYTLFSWSFLLVVTIILVKQLDLKEPHLQNSVKLLNILILVIVLGTFQQQLNFSKSYLEKKTQRAFAQQLLKFGLGDSEAQQAIYPDYARLLSVSDKYRLTKMFNFSSQLFAEKFGGRFVSRDKAFCTAYIETARFVDSNSNFMIVKGWIAEPSSKDSRINPIRITFYNGMDMNVGTGFVGLERQDVSMALKIKNVNFGFLAVIDSKHIGDELFIDTTNCSSKVISLL
jgi:hypothetical protein